MVYPTEIIQPNEEHHIIYTDLYEIFKDAFLTWKESNIYDRLNAVCDKYWN